MCIVLARSFARLTRSRRALGFCFVPLWAHDLYRYFFFVGGGRHQMQHVTLQSDHCFWPLGPSREVFRNLYTVVKNKVRSSIMTRDVSIVCVLFVRQEFNVYRRVCGTFCRRYYWRTDSKRNSGRVIEICPTLIFSNRTHDRILLAMHEFDFFIVENRSKQKK